SQYALADMILSQPYLKSGTVLFVNASLDSNSLEDKRYAGLEGGSIPAGVNKDKVIYYKTREATLNAVDMGQADYGYGNAYSVSYYTLKNGYKNIVTIPRGIETREYCIGLVKEDYILLSIINKAIASMDETAVQTLILDMTSKIDRKITLPMILDLYDLEIFLGSMLIIGLLILGIATNVRAKHHLKIENQRYKILSHISNEYLYEYNFKSDRLTLSESLSHIFLNRQDLDLFKARLKEDLIKQNFKEIIPRLDLPLSKSERRIFKGINSKIYDDRNNIYSVIGKLVDVTEETAEKDALITKAQVDGLTGLYNASTTKELILEKIEARDNLQKDVFMIIDGDRFKEINDTFGHLEGNRVLKKIAQAMRLTFRQTDIIGRVGGDEFA
ncbi:MAG TPA: GGDEF domain-containing protein, partial [Tissierellaceae bacterium]|nr:GGDEF domain-containing protein [Tissierellaceae bacterium]